MFPALDTGRVGILNQPTVNYRLREGWVWGADNGCFNRATYVGDVAWFAWLLAQHHKERCLFASAPDVVGDWDATLAVSAPWLPRIREAGYPAALVLQDGATVRTVPWDSLDAVFVGGSTAWKMHGTAQLIVEALRRGKHVHVGRVNSWRRFSYFARQGVHSADGTYIAFGPDVNVPAVLAWQNRFAQQLSLI
jgi:hypothetical protein